MEIKKEKNQKVAIYIRVSTTDQNPEMQHRELLAHADRNGWDPTIYADAASGAKNTRPAFTRLLADAHDRQFEIVLVWKLDRFGRSLLNLVSTIQTLDSLGIKFVSLKDNIDMTTAAGRLMLHLLAAFAEFERSMLSERVKSGMANAKAKGIPIGAKSLVPPTEIKACRDRGLSHRQIARELGISLGSVQHALAKFPKLESA